MIHVADETQNDDSVGVDLAVHAHPHDGDPGVEATGAGLNTEVEITGDGPFKVSLYLKPNSQASQPQIFDTLFSLGEQKCWALLGEIPGPRGGNIVSFFPLQISYPQSAFSGLQSLLSSLHLAGRPHQASSITTWTSNPVHGRTFTGKSYGIMGCTTHEGTAFEQTGASNWSAKISSSRPVLPSNVNGMIMPREGHPAVDIGAVFRKFMSLSTLKNTDPL